MAEYYNKQISSILVVTPNYPIEGEPVYPFVKDLCEQFVKIGCEVTVISPQSITSSILHHKNIRPRKRYENVGNSKILIFQPFYITLPFKYHTINNFLLRQCLKHFCTKNQFNHDVIYCHFWSSAFAALPYAKLKEIPLFVASGESVIGNLFSNKFGTQNLRDYISGVICVSNKNREESVSLGLTEYSKCKVFPNAINSDLFYYRDKEKCRQDLCIHKDAFIVIFVGWFIERKGPLRVSKAIEQVTGVKSIFIGSGDQNPDCKDILFKGSLPHNMLPIYLGAADIFVLPTLHEGCCNAIIEAMACGLPIISSDLDFNRDILNDSNSILIDPNNISEIANAICTLRDNKQLRSKLSKGALYTAKSLTLNQRANSILDFMNKCIIA